MQVSTEITCGNTQAEGCWPTILVALAAAVVHLPMLLSDSTIWDSCIIENAIVESDRELLQQTFTTSGGPDTALLHEMIGWLPMPLFIYRLLSYICVILSAGAVYRLCRQVQFWGTFEGFAIAIIATAFPCYALWQEPIMLPYSLAYAAFFVGGSIYLAALRSSPSPRLARVTGLLLLIYSFKIPSFLVEFYLLFLFFYLVAAPVVTLASAVAFGRKHAAILLLPPVYFFARRVLAPVHELYEGYNSITISADHIGKWLIVAPKRIFIDQTRDLLHFVSVAPGFFLALAAICTVVLLPVMFAASRLPSRPISRAQFLASLGFAVLLYLAGALPYSLVGKFPVINSYNSRHALLASVPAAIAIVSCARFIFRGHVAFSVVIFVSILLSTVVQTRNYVLWQNRSIKYLAIVQALKRTEGVPPGVVLVRDEVPLGMQENLRTFEINWMLKRAFGQELWYGVNAGISEGHLQIPEPHPGKRKIYMFRDFSDQATGTLITARQRDDAFNLDSWCRYLISSTETRAELLDSLVEVNLEPCAIQQSLDGTMIVDLPQLDSSKSRQRPSQPALQIVRPPTLK